MPHYQNVSEMDDSLSSSLAITRKKKKTQRRKSEITVPSDPHFLKVSVCSRWSDVPAV